VEIKDDIFSVADLYDTFFIDMYGVLFDGSELYSGTLATLKKLKEMGKKIVLVSNTSQLSSDAMRGYTERGMNRGTHYDHFVTAGELLHNILVHHKDVFNKQIGKELSSVKYLFMGNTNVFKDTEISRADTYEDADLVYVASPRSHYGSVRVDNLYDENGNKVEIEEFLDRDWKTLRDDQGRQGLAEFALQLEKLSALGKTLFLSNPDVFAPFRIDDGKHPVATQGAIGFYYEKVFGGKVLYFGKPFVEIFEFAKKVSSSENDKILMIGDTLWTDVLGAHNAGIDSALVMTGISGEFFRKMAGKHITEKLEVLKNKIGSKLSCAKQDLKSPTHILRHFYGDLV
jgi:HAD superfamily hydrolase (TIGR01450 family)